MHLEFAQGL